MNYLSFSLDTPNVPTFITPELVIGLSISVTTIILIAALIKFRRRRIVVHALVSDKPEKNMTCHELWSVWFFDSFDVIVVESSSNNILGVYYLPVHLNMLLAYIKVIIKQLRRIDNILESEYDRAENLTSFPIIGVNPTAYDESLDILNGDKKSLICHLRKLESIYLKFVPTYIREPEYIGESL